jgi:hypothetical protein
MGALDPGLERLRQELVHELSASEARMRQHVEAAELRTHEHVEGFEARTRERIEAVEARVEAAEVRTRQHVETTGAETRRHFDVVGKALLGKIELVAEGLAAFDERMERFRGEVHENFAKVDRRFLHMEARILSALERR